MGHKQKKNYFSTNQRYPIGHNQNKTNEVLKKANEA